MNVPVEMELAEQVERFAKVALMVVGRRIEYDLPEAYIDFQLERVMNFEGS